jgi:phosphoglycolate phosphatase
MNNKTVIFDFDGTLADTLSTAIEIYNSVASSYGAKTISQEDIALLRSSRPQELMRNYGVTFWNLPRLALQVKQGLKQQPVRLHPEIQDVIYKLSADGYTLGILSSNDVDFILPILEQNHLLDTFTFVEGYGRIFGKHRALKRIMRVRKLDPADVIYIGDETRDIEAAKRAGVSPVAVTWGFQTRNAFEKISTPTIVDSQDELLAEISKLPQ